MDLELFEIKLGEYFEQYKNAQNFPRKKKKEMKLQALKLASMLKSAFRHAQSLGLVC